jgi:hypothetical protein
MPTQSLPFEGVRPEGGPKRGGVLPGAVPEFAHDIQQVATEDGSVLIRLSFRGVHSGPFGAPCGRVVCCDVGRFGAGGVLLRRPPCRVSVLLRRSGIATIRRLGRRLA